MARALKVYQELFDTLARLRSDISRKIELAGVSLADPVTLSELMAVQAELKNTVSGLLDKLMQADIDVAFNFSGKRAINGIK